MMIRFPFSSWMLAIALLLCTAPVVSGRDGRAEVGTSAGDGVHPPVGNGHDPPHPGNGRPRGAGHLPRGGQGEHLVPRGGQHEAPQGGAELQPGVRAGQELRVRQGQCGLHGPPRLGQAHNRNPQAPERGRGHRLEICLWPLRGPHQAGLPRNRVPGHPVQLRAHRTVRPNASTEPTTSTAGPAH